MKEYYYLEGEEQKGPFSLDDLKSTGLTSETFVWMEDMDNWKKLKELPELQEQLAVKKTPPPPPPKQQTPTKSEVSGHLQISKAKEPNELLDILKPSRKGLTFFMIWTAFNLFALLMSYTEIDFFNDIGNQRTDAFWPFVDFVSENAYFIDDDPLHSYNKSRYRQGEWVDEFNGIFVQYDWSEFLVYVGGALIIFIIGRVSNNKNETPAANKG